MLLPEEFSSYPIPEVLKPVVDRAHALLREWGVDPHGSISAEKPPRFRNNFWNLFAEVFGFQPFNESWSYFSQLEKKFPGLMERFVQENENFLVKMKPIYEVMVFVEDPIRDEVIRLINVRDFEVADAFAAVSGFDLLYFSIHSRLTPLLIDAAQRMESLGIRLEIG